MVLVGYMNFHNVFFFLIIYFFSLHVLEYPSSVVIMEGDPHPGSVKGRMSFQSFNPLIDVSIMVRRLYDLVSILSCGIFLLSVKRVVFSENQ